MAINISLELPLVWDSSEVGAKDKLQKMVFPDGISYFHKNGIFLTDKVNEVFKPIPRLNCISESDKNKQGSISAALSNLVGRTGFEPATPWSQTTYSTGLNYLPIDPGQLLPTAGSR